MHPYFVVLSAVALLLACIGTSTASAATSVAYLTTVRSDHVSNTPSMRLLRSHDNNEEERAGVLDKITELAKAGASKVKEGAVRAHDVGMLQSYLHSADDGVQVLNKLKLGDDIVDTLRNSRLETLSEYVKMFNNKYPESKITVTGALSAKYGDDVVATALASAQSSTQDKKVADEMKVLRKEQQQVWFKEGKSADDVVNLLKLREGGYEVLRSQKMNVLEDYIKYMNRKSPHPTTLLDALTNGLGGESKLLTMLTRANKEVRTMKEAKKMEALLLQKWLAKDELPEKVFKMLKLDNDHSYAFRSDNLNVFRTYVLDFNKKNPSQKFSTIKILTASYNEVEVVHALAAKVMVRGDDTANLLLGEQLLGWFKSGKTVDDVYALLKLPQDGTAAFVNWKLETMTAYIKLLNRHDLDESLIKTLLKHFDGDMNLATALEKATTNPSTAVLAEKIQQKQFKVWVEDGVQPNTFLSSVFNVHRATDEQNAIAAKFKTYYDSAKKPGAFVDPRRF